MVEWIRAHRDFAPGVRVEFSSTARFFAAVDPHREKCPIVEGHLEPHAIGCYSVCGALKRALRASELDLVDCERIVRQHAGPQQAAYLQELGECWKTICFNQFHDILPGSAVREAIEIARAQAGGVRDRVSRIVHQVLRRDSGLARKSKVTGHRLHLVNRLDIPWSGIAEEEVWMDWQGWHHHLEDESGKPVPFQVVPPSYLEFVEGKPACTLPRLLFPADVPTGGHRVFRIRPGDSTAALPGEAPTFSGTELTNGVVTVGFNQFGFAKLWHTARGPGWSLLAAPLSFACIADDSDTWSHSIESFGGPVVSSAQFEAPVLVYAGPIRTMVRLAGNVGTSPLRLFVWLNRGESRVHMRLDASYQERMTLLKACFTPHFGIAKRHDRVAGGWLVRPGDGKEYPLHHAVVTESQTIGRLGILLPDSFAMDGTSGSLRPTLIRNNLNAYNQWSPHDWSGHPRVQDRFGSDEGPNSIRLSLVVGAEAEPERMEAMISCMQRPPHAWDDFKGDTNRLSRFAAS